MRRGVETFFGGECTSTWSIRSQMFVSVFDQFNTPDVPPAHETDFSRGVVESRETDPSVW
jgi:hypothetical protein